MRRRFIVVAAVVAAVAGVNAVAYLHARAMTRYADGGRRTAPPEELGWLEAARVIVTGVTMPRPRNGRTPADLELGFDMHRIPGPDGTTLEAWYVPGTDAETVVLGFHGYAASKAALLPSARGFHELGYDTLLVDFQGSGGSSGTDTSLGFREARDVAATVAYARQQWPGRRIVLYGFSMGGAALLRAVAAEGVRPDAIIIEATFDRLLNTAKRRFHSMGLPATPFAELLLFWGGFEWGFDAFSHNPEDYARAVSCPVLILHGADDARVPPEQARALHRAMGAPARLVAYPGVPHMLIVEARPEEWRREVAGFLRTM